MSYPIDVDAQNAALDLLLGTGVPATFEVAIFDGDPTAGGSELTGTAGVARAVVDNDAALFPDPAAGGLKTAAAVPFDDPSGSWSVAGRWFVLIDRADSTTRWWYGLLAEPLLVLSTTTDISIEPACRWNTEGF